MLPAPQISLKDGRLNVAFRFETKKQNYSSVSEFQEELKLDEVDLEKMEAIFDIQQGVLRIEAPLKRVNAQIPGQIKLEIQRSSEKVDQKKIDS